uniref:Triadin n=1 Tax=Leptobrachium leishanense TaxID=445787 RepID=A0A8C5Q0E0_9ANUR
TIAPGLLVLPGYLWPERGRRQGRIGRSSTTTTVLDGKNGSVHKPSVKVANTVAQDLKTTFRSPVAWLLVAALIVTWSSVVIVMFDLVDYKALSVLQRDKGEKTEKLEIKSSQKVLHKTEAEVKEKSAKKPPPKGTIISLSLSLCIHRYSYQYQMNSRTPN